MSDLTLPTARAERDYLAERVDVLDKVGVLATLADDIHVTTDMVAAFYEVPIKTVQTIVQRNCGEIEEDGYRVVTRGAFEEAFNVKVTSSAPRIALYPRRAVLRVGMLLRDSGVARLVRTYLLDAEQNDHPAAAAELTEDEIVHRALQITSRKVKELEATVADMAPKVDAYERFIDGDGTYAIGAAAKILGRAQNRLFADLRNAGILIAKGSMKNTPYQRYMHHFEVKAHDFERSDGSTGTSYTTRVQPSGLAFIARKLGLSAVLDLEAVPA
ncbi:hypothetical protein CH276_14030 [Rhodococcus sp. 06-470-2]|uniref:phage antirepressor KilAC domain-containing protein n=1 Tax=unclassified Rhodococcus (in: high G+C Gram-positive bacteria) TaxID=192944 RepID=UPI000B9A813D|nr:MULTISPECIES: phage antirepressor KilAC domain-containing protein [unclassified Rhodococcus (in: high G+C Gram-positive bacteria)]OZC62736.1 hypothetical protein CH276_14030 [Rhodococcus sp. 06-470-2]OZE71713.1 hypothetical protein CH265_01510 [Rhodococcus sp. 05-2221-1B]